MSTTMIDVENPATGEAVGAVPKLGAGEVQELAAGARAAQPAWHALGFAARRATFLRAQRWLVDNRRRVVDAIVAESGKPSADALVEVFLAVEALIYWGRKAEGYLREERAPARPPFLLGRSVRVRYEPLGLVGVISPWNAAFSLAVLDAVPALAAGNAVVLKPSEITPLSGQLIQEMFAAAGMPAGVCQVATGDGETGAAVVDVADFVIFTGSAATGRKVMERGARTLTPVAAELGGNDPMIVLADADLRRAAAGAVYYSMFNAGQICMSVERVYVEDDVHDRFVALVREEVAKLRVGASGTPGAIDIGPIIFPPQIDKIEAHIDDAVARGATVVTGGARAARPGRYFEPTILTNVDHSMAVMRDETFGPVLPIMRVRDAEEALRLANESDYGLQGSVFSGDRARGEALARRLEVGGCTVNDAQLNLAAFGAPFGGWKDSGVGGRHGAAGIRKYCRTQTVLVNRLPLQREANWFPYRPGVERLVHAALVARSRMAALRSR